MRKRVAFAIIFIVVGITHCRNITKDNDKGLSLSDGKKLIHNNPTSDIYNLHYLKAQSQMQYSLKPDSKKKTRVKRSSSSRKHCKCGVSHRSRNRITNRIINGNVARKNEYPWQVGLKLHGSRQTFCGGSIISSKTILTAAHCMLDKQRNIISTSQLYVVLGEHDVTKKDGEVNYDVYSKVVHPNFNKKNLDYDYAILILHHDIAWNHHIKPVCLPDSSNKYENMYAVVSGWGTMIPQKHTNDFPDKLMKADVKTKTNAWCSRAYQSKRLMISPRMLCAIGDNKDSCRGDSGGPLVIEAGRKTKRFYILAGIVSWGSDMCNTPGEPGVYARVTNQLTWIIRNMKGSICPRPY